jgi:Family of unknown function (DUF6049)
MPRQRPTSRGRLRQLAAAGGIAALAGLAPALSAGGVRASTVTAASPQQVTAAITSMSPQIARPGQRVTVSGTVTNPTGAVVASLAVQLWSSTARFTARSQLASYASGQLSMDSPVTGAVDQLAGTLKPGQTRQWTVTVPVARLGFASGFGVYPLAAQLDSGGSPVADAYTFLPFWPGSVRAAGLARPEQLAWIWPLIGQPEEAACHSLLNDSLAGSLTSSGRLGGLLADGTSTAGVAAKLTWAIDPSLLSSAALMTHSYRVGGTPSCAGTQTRRASPAARAWLAKVHALARQQDFFTTPYADVDVSALAHAGLDNDLARALNKGREVAAGPSQLGGVQRPAGPRIDWPADGIADYGVLGSLAANQIGAVVLNSSMMPPARPVAYTPSAITTTPDGVNAGLRVALADSTLTQVLAGAPTAAHPPSAAASFGTEQRFLAETAMIAAEDPGLPRSVVITPPRQWNPAPGLANALLQETDSAPWLRPASLSSLLAKHPGRGQVARKQPPPQAHGPGELHKSLLRKVRGLEAAIRVQASMLNQPDDRYLSGAVAAIESSAWRGDPAKARQLLSSVAAFVAARSHLVHIVRGSGQVTLTGKSGPVPVSIVNRMGQPVTVRLLVQAPANRLTILYKSTLITIPPSEQKTVAVKVRSLVAASTNLKLSLLAPNKQPLPGPAAQISVDATHFGTEALVIIAVACGLFVVTSAVRAVRRGMRRTPGSSPGQGATPGDPGGSPDETDTVSRKPAPGVNQSKRAADTHEEPDEYASAPGWVERP